MTFDINDLPLDSNLKRYAQTIFGYSNIEYNPENDSINNDSICIINGINIHDELLTSARKQYNTIIASRVKENKLRVPHAWRDIKIKDDDDPNQCNICMARKRQIIFNCGHYHTCAKCSRTIIKADCKCPMCKVTITTVTRVFA